MPHQPLFRIPLAFPYRKVVGQNAYRIVFDVEVEDRFGNFIPIPFRLDTGSDFTTIPISLARQFDIPFDHQQTGVHPKTASGKSERPSFPTPVWISFPALPLVRPGAAPLKFQSHCLFSPDLQKRGLLSLNDVVPNFLVRSNRANRNYPHGFVVFQLRKDHKGQPRP